ncbi:hypothetical protein SAMN05216597_2612 [Pseudomonas cannabina]|nr:hypothetical protein SAMN05216597_2612 [Pseudomonas cannabina]
MKKLAHYWKSNYLPKFMQKVPYIMKIDILVKAIT